MQLLTGAFVTLKPILKLSCAISTEVVVSESLSKIMLFLLLQNINCVLFASALSLFVDYKY